MVRIHFSSEDLTRTTIAAAADPLWEVLLSLHMLQDRGGALVYGRWRRQVRAKPPAAVRLLLELAPPTGYSADFLTPPGGPAGLDEALETLLSTPRRQLRADLAYLATRRPATAWTRKLAEADSETMRLLGRAVRSYHDSALGPYWKPLRGRVAADRAHRGEQLISGGLDRLLPTLHPRARWEPPVLHIADLAAPDIHLEGRGLTLVPSYFCWQAPTKLRDTDLPPVLVYPIAHRPGELEPANRTDRSRLAPLSALLGRTRAVALDVMATGCTTTQLAAACHVSVPTASHHAAVLREARLISSRRVGGAVVHELTAVGTSLLDGRDPSTATADAG
jgi:DNA-binding transcriptional ArsR family regulator